MEGDNEVYVDFDDPTLDPHEPCIVWFPTSFLRMVVRGDVTVLRQVWQTKCNIGPVMTAADLQGPPIMIPDNPNLSEWRDVQYFIEEEDERNDG